MRCLITMPLLLALAGCADLGYYWHSASGHLEVMERRVDIDEMLADAELEAGLRERLELIKEIRRFSVERLDLPDNDSYLSYAELDRPYLIQNLFAAPEFSTQLYRWCYPVVGCASYRGYYDDERLQAYVEELEAEGFEVYIGKVSAYSTLGWFDDPVLSTFIDWPDHRLAGLLFHELMHQQIYIDDDTTFNESLATAVQQVGTELWLESRNREDQIERMSEWLRYRAEVMALIEATRGRLDGIYQRDIDDGPKRDLKAETFERARRMHAEIAARHGIRSGYTRWFAGELNNAKIGSVSTYNAMTPAFIAMIRAFDYDFSGFYGYVARLGEFEKKQRNACLEQWSNGSGESSADCPAMRAGETTAS